MFSDKFVEILVLAILPALLSIAVVLVTRTIVAGRTRRQLIDARLPADVVHALDATDQAERIHSALKWGLVGMAVGVGIIVIQFLPEHQGVAIDFGIVVMSGGLALLLFYRLAPRPPGPPDFILENSQPPPASIDIDE